MSINLLFRFYRRHLRVQPLRELMAVLGVAAGVALLFAVQIANSSVTGSFEEVLHGLAGRATLEVATRSPEGFTENVTEQVARVPGVRAAAPVLSQPVVVVGSKGSSALTLLGSDERLGGLGSELISRFEHDAEASRRGLLVLTAPTAHAIGARPGDVVAVKVGELTRHVAVDAVVPSDQLGALAESPVAAAPLPIVQILSGLRDRISRILIEPTSGRETEVREVLTHRFGATLNVRSIDAEAQLLKNAAKPEAQLTALFSAISLVVGMILAYNALLLASGERRAFITYLLELGTPDKIIIASLAFDALVLGITGSVIGLLTGDAISLLAYRAPPGYLTAAFPIGNQHVVTLPTILIALAAGMFAAFAAAALPAIGMLRSTPAEPEGRVLSLLRLPSFSDTLAFACGGLLICISVGASLLWPAVIVVALVTFIAGLVLCLPTFVRYSLRLARLAVQRSGDPSARLASGELQKLSNSFGRLGRHGHDRGVLDGDHRGRRHRCSASRACRCRTNRIERGHMDQARRRTERVQHPTVRLHRNATSPTTTPGRALGTPLPAIVLGPPRPPRVGHRHTTTGIEPNRGQPTSHRRPHHSSPTPARRRLGRNQPNDRKPMASTPRRPVQSPNTIRLFELPAGGDDLKLWLATRHDTLERRRIRKALADNQCQSAGRHATARSPGSGRKAHGAASTPNRVGPDRADSTGTAIAGQHRAG